MNESILQELEDMKKRLKEIEEEASALREMQAKVEKEMGAVQGFILIIIMLFNFRRFHKFSLIDSLFV